MTEMLKSKLIQFLYFGYNLDYTNHKVNLDFTDVDKSKYADYAENELINIGTKIWQEVINSSYASHLKHCIPLSGGIDSRAILAGLLKNTDATSLKTYTFGTPGTWDFEIGNEIAKKIGTKHTRFDLSKESYNQSELLDVAKRVDHQTILFHHPPLWKLDDLYNDCFIWSGFMGDPLAGSHLFPEMKSRDEVIRFFLKKNKFSKSINLISNVDIEKIVKFKFIDSWQVSQYEQIDFMIRQLKYIAPHVLIQGFNYKLPFLHKTWVDFIMSVDDKFRFNQDLYFKILLKAYPTIFKYKTKTKYGLGLDASKNKVKMFHVMEKIIASISLKSKSINYLDFNNGIRKRKDLKRVVSENVMDLGKRKLIDWIDIDKILIDHMNNKGNYADALIVLSSLEFHLKNDNFL